MDGKTLAECKAIYREAFGDDASFVNSFFAAYAEKDLRVLRRDGHAVSAFFSVPMTLTEAGKTRPCRYIFALATKKEERGRGYARELLRAEIARGEPLFLHPAEPSLRAFYEKLGFRGFCPAKEIRGAAAGGPLSLSHPEKAAYPALRVPFLPAVSVGIPQKFLASDETLRAVTAKEFCALYFREGEEILFEEALGDLSLLPRVTKALGGKTYRATVAAPGGEPFLFGVGMPADARFFAVLA